MLIETERSEKIDCGNILFTKKAISQKIGPARYDNVKIVKVSEPRAELDAKKTGLS